MAKSPTYEAFMLDHAAGNLSEAMMMAGDLHMLLSDEGANICQVWRCAAETMGHNFVSKNIDTASGIISDASETVRWRRGFSGAQYAKSGPKGGKLMRLLPGKSVPVHGHKSLEVTVVIQGELSDGETVFKAGDIAFGEPGIRHKPAAKGVIPCVCYVAKK